MLLIVSLNATYFFYNILINYKYEIIFSFFYVYMIVFIVLFSLLICVFISEFIDRKKIPDLPDCKYITNYCNNYGIKNDIAYVIKEPTKSENIDILLSKIENDSNRLTFVIYWRISLIISIIACIFYYIYNYLSNKQISIESYFFLLIMLWFLNYWSRNYLDFHYYDHKIISIKESIGKLKTLLKNNKI